MEKYILTKLNKLSKEKLVSFHVPGHKNGKIYDVLGYKNILNKLYKLDTTEIEGTDNLHNAKEIIKKSQEDTAKVFNTKETIYLINGTTCGIQAAIMAICPPKSKIIVNRDCHQSVINACILGDIEPKYIEHNICQQTNIIKGLKKDKVKEVIDNNQDAKAIVITYPTYYGETCDLKYICEYAHSKNMIVIVDEAHGAHLQLSDKLPESSIEQGADITIHSTHKTLPAFTQSSMLHINRNIDKNKILQILRFLESSSPSYLLLTSLELAVDIYKKHGRRLMEELLDRIEKFKSKFKNNRDILIYNNSDKTKIFISLKEIGITGYQLDCILRENYNVQVELSNYYGVLLVATIGNIDNDFLKLEEALEDILKNSKYKNQKLKEIVYPNNIPTKILNPREAFYSNKKIIKLNDSVGKISGEYIIPYPPGISLISPGEIITQEIITYIQNGIKNGMIVNGIKDTTLEFIEIIDIEDNDF